MKASSSAVTIRASDGSSWKVSKEEFVKLKPELNRAAKVLSFPEEEGKVVGADAAIAALFPNEPSGAVVLRGARAKAKMTQSKLAEKLGVTQPDVANMEKGRRAISKEMAKKLGEIFDTDYRIFL
jgi:DNA-binding XRE family transcriptional regulator